MADPQPSSPSTDSTDQPTTSTGDDLPDANVASAPPDADAATPAVAPVISPVPDSADSLADELMSLGGFESVETAVSGTGGGTGGGAVGGDGASSSAESTGGKRSSPAANIAELEALLRKANFTDTGEAESDRSLGDRLLAEAKSAGGHTLPATEQFDLPAFENVLSEAASSSIDLLRDVELNVKIELGRSRMLVEDVLKLAEGAVVELDKLAGDPVDVYVNDRLVARGEVLVLNDSFCVRVNEIVQSLKEEV